MLKKILLTAFMLASFYCAFCIGVGVTVMVELAGFDWFLACGCVASLFGVLGFGYGVYALLKEMLVGEE